MLISLHPSRTTLTATALLLVAYLHPAAAQTFTGCMAPAEAVDGNVVVRCRHVTIEIEQRADVNLSDRDRNGEPGHAIVRSGAVYLTGGSSPTRGAFQVRTPDAVASVRGTEWVVDVGAAQTATFVVQGVVAVQRRIDNQAVVLTSGEGVDVAPVSNPLVVKRWPVPRVRALLARFGR